MQNLSEKELEKIWSREAKNYSVASETSPDYLAHFQIIHQVMGDVRHKKILDVGSGTAITSAYLAKQGADLTLIDISDEALSFGRKYFALHKIKGKFIKQNAFNMKFLSNSFDVVWNGGVIEHFVDADKIKMIRNMWRLVKPGGKLIIAAPNAWDIPFILAKQVLIMRKKWNFGQEDDLTKSRMIKLAQKAGINNAKTFCYNPVVGWWFFPYGREVTNMLGLNNLNFHKITSYFGHNIVLTAVKDVFGKKSR